MRQVQDKRRGNRWPVLAVLVAFGALVFPASSVSWAEPPDSAKPGLREGVFVPMNQDTTKRERSPVAMAALERLNQNSAKRWGVDWNESTGLPNSIFGSSYKPQSGDLSQAAIDFTQDHLGLFLGTTELSNIADYSFEVTRTRTDDQIGTSKRVQAYYKGVKLYQAYASIIFSVDGNIVHSYNFLRPIQLDDVTPSLTVTEVEQIIRKAAPDSVGQHDGKMDLVVYPSSPPRLAYYAYRFIDGWNWDLLINAHSGDFLSAIRIGVIDRMPNPVESEDDTDSVKSNRSKVHPIYHQRLPVYPSPGRHSVEKRENRQPKSSRWSHKELPVFSRVLTDERSYPPKEKPAPAGASETQLCCWFYGPTNGEMVPVLPHSTPLI